jgi:hypothetical protein
MMKLHEDSRTRQAPRSFPSSQEIRAVEIGADELVSRAEWALRRHPRTLRNVRRAYLRLCVFVLGQVKRASQERRSNSSQARTT